MEVRKDEKGHIVNRVWPPEKVQAEATLDELAREQTRKSVIRAIPIDDDETALSVAPACPEWSAGEHYAAGDIINRNGQAYRVIQAVDAIESQPPDADGMLAVYRPLNLSDTGTAGDPIPYFNGMDVYTGKYYSFNGKTYLAKADMIPCVWDPGTAGLWQWEEIA